MAAPTADEVAYYQSHTDDNQQGKLMAAAISCLVLAWAFIGLRFLARSRLEVGFKSDDWVIVAAGCSFTAFPIAIFVLVSVGFGKHIIYVTNPKLMVEMVVLCELAYAVTIPLTKVSILLLYNRIFPSQRVYWISIAITIVTVIYAGALAIVCILQCIPLSTLWAGGDGWCMNTTPPYTATAVANVVTDVLILCLPMKYVYNLQMPIRRKAQIMVLFALGGCVCVFGVIRSIEVGTASSQDQSWSTVPGTIWSVVEPCVGIISACLPTLRPLLPFDREVHTGYTNYSRNGNAANGSAEQKRRFNAGTMLGNKSKGTVWSTVTAGLDTTRGNDDVEEHPFVKLDANGKAASVNTGEGNMVNGSREAGSGSERQKKPSFSDIHVRKEFHQEVSRAESTGSIV